MSNASPSLISALRPSSLPPTDVAISGSSTAPTAPVNTLPPGVRAKKMFTTVRKVATQMARRLPRHVDVEDLVGAGAVGLADAFSRRNGMPGSEFEAFASYRVRGAMLDELRRLDAMPRRTRARAKEVVRATRVVEQRNGGAAKDEDVARELGIDVSAYHAMQSQLEASRGPIQLGSTVNGEDEPIHELVDARAEMPDVTVARMEVGELVVEGINTLPERMRDVLVGLYVEGHTLKNLGLLMGVSESRVCQIHGEALAILRARLGDSHEAAPPASCRRLRSSGSNGAQGQTAVSRTRMA